MMADYYWIDGDLLPRDQAPAYLRNWKPDEAVSLSLNFRCFDTDAGPALFRLEEHVRQFVQGARDHGLEVYISIEEFCERVHRTLIYNGFRDGHVRLVLLTNPDRNRRQLGRRKRPETVLVIGMWERNGHAAEAALQPSADSGAVLKSEVPEEAALFIFREGRILTPHSKTFGNTLVRSTIMTLARDLGYEVEERSLTADQVASADEVFLGHANGEITFVREFNRRTIGGGGPGAVTQALQQAFTSTVQGRGKRSREWLDWVSGSNLGI